MKKEDGASDPNTEKTDAAKSASDAKDGAVSSDNKPEDYQIPASAFRFVLAQLHGAAIALLMAENDPKSREETLKRLGVSSGKDFDEMLNNYIAGYLGALAIMDMLDAAKGDPNEMRDLIDASNKSHAKSEGDSWSDDIEEEPQALDALLNSVADKTDADDSPKPSEPSEKDSEKDGKNVKMKVYKA
jgi:hypothetical protein